LTSIASTPAWSSQYSDVSDEGRTSMAGACRSTRRSWARRRSGRSYQRGVQGADAAHRTGSIARDGRTTVESDDIGEALENMRFAGGEPNVKPLVSTDPASH
jgi:hypothetical protein